MIKVRKNYYQLFRIPFIALFTFFPVGITGCILLIKEYLSKNGDVDPILYLSLLGCIGLALISFWPLYLNLFRTPSISFSNSTFYINGKLYSWEDIEIPNLTGKFRYQSAGRYKIKELQFKEGMTIRLKNGEIMYFYNHFYIDLNRFKNKLAFIFSQPNVVSINFYVSKNLNIRDSQFKSLRGIITWSIVAYLLIKNLGLSQSININGKIFILAFCFLILYVQSRYMHYFLIENGKIIIKNENLLWINTTIEVKDILEVVLDKNVMPIEIMKSKNLRIILKDYQEFRYGADLLKNTHWEMLKSYFKLNGIVVRDEF